MSAFRSRALFLDRDGTLVEDTGYLRDPAVVRLLPDVATALREAREVLGYRLVIVSNQSGVARGLIRPEQAEAVQARLARLLAVEGVTLDGAYFCFHGPGDGCACRKPQPGLVLDAAASLGVDLGSSIMIGDRTADVEAGLAAGCAAVALSETHQDDALATFDSWASLLPWLRSRG